MKRIQVFLQQNPLEFRPRNPKGMKQNFLLRYMFLLPSSKATQSQ